MTDLAKKRRISEILNGALQTEMPQDIMPMNFKLTQKPFSGEEWQFEIKWDGFRVLSYNDVSHVNLRSRNNTNFNKRFSSIQCELQKLNIHAVLDGEVVVLDENNCSDFDRLLSGEKDCLIYYVFDILWYDGFNLMNLPLEKRRELLELILPSSETVRFSAHIDDKGEALFNQIQNHKIEGIVAKKKDSIYLPGTRTGNWLKIKSAKVTEGFVAGLLLNKEKTGSGFSSLIIGVEEENSYKCIGLVESGISPKALHEILRNGRAREQSIFAEEPKVNRNSAFRKKIMEAEIIWLNADIKCKVKYLELDKYGMMRHASFRGLTA